MKCEPRCLLIFDWFGLVVLLTTSSSTLKKKKIAIDALMTCVSPSSHYLRLTWFFSQNERGSSEYLTLFYILTVLLFWIRTTQTTEPCKSRCRTRTWYFTPNICFFFFLSFFFFFNAFAEIGIVFWEVQQYSSNELCLRQPMLQTRFCERNEDSRRIKKKKKNVCMFLLLVLEKRGGSQYTFSRR